MDCPRCEVAMHEARARGGVGGAYREAWSMVWQCGRCRGQLLVANDSGNLAASLARSMLVRERVKAPQLCPVCSTNLVELTLSWGDHCVELEECPGCQSVFVHNGELERTRSLMRAAASLQATELGGEERGPSEADPIQQFLESVRELLAD